MKFWCTKKKREVTREEAEQRCFRQNTHRGCKRLTRKRKNK